MSSNSTISIAFQIKDGPNGFKELTMDVGALRKMMQSTVVESEKLHGKIINFGNLSQGLDSLSSMFQQLQGFTKDLTAAYDTQMEAERRLEQVMKNTMKARAEDVQEIKDFCSAQQQIGIVGDEVQLAGAQEMATYLKFKGSLKTLIPVMNDMVAQQYGYNHTAENAVGIATMLGKVMNGQTSALSRLGYTFDDAQEKILKYGTESEKAAVLVEVVGESVGKMNRKLAETDTGRMKQLENNLGDFKEMAGGLIKSAEPILTIGSNATIAVMGVMKLIKGVKMLIVSMRALLLAGGAVTLAITAIAAAYFYFTSQTDAATKSIKELTDAKKQLAREEERSKEIAEAEDDARKGAISSIELNIARLKDFKGSKAEEKKLVGELNDTYGRTMGYFKSVSEWYNALIKNSKAYCDQMVAEAKARTYANQIADLEMQRDKIVYNDDGSKKLYSTKKNEKVEWEEYIDERNGLKRLRKIGKSKHDLATESVANLDKQIAEKKRRMAESAAKVEMPAMGSSEETDLGGGGKSGGGNTNTTPKTRLQEIDAAIKENEEKWINASDAEKEAIHSTVQALQEEKRQIELQKEALSVPTELKSLDDYNKAISYQQKLRSMASAEEIAQHDEVIKRLNDEVAAMERSAHVAVDIDKISTYKQLQEEISYYTDLLQNGTEEEKRFATENLPALMKKEKAMGLQNAGIGVATDPAQANNLEEIGAAISLLDQKIQNASADEVDALQRSKMAFEEKKKAMERGIEIPSMVREADEINRLTGKEYKLKIRGMGFDELTEKIRELQKMLKDTENPVTDSQRKDIESLIATYEKWRKEGVNTFDTYRSGWDGIKGLGSGIESLTSVLEGNGNAWQKATGIIDGFLQIYDGIKTIVGIIDMLSLASTAHTTAKTAEAVAVGTAAGAQTAEAVAAETNAAAQIPVIAANKLATASYMELAAAAYFAAHASIPFAGFGIASGFVSAATAMVEAIGVMPFAEGGIVSGPTLGLVGEYAGAKSNPEVIAPLNRLKDLIGNDENGANGRVEFEIRGDRLYGLLRKYERNKNRT